MADWIPGINVGNAVRQVGSVVGLAPKGDYDVLDSYTNSNRAGQTQVNWLPDVTSGPQVLGTQAPTAKPGETIIDYGPPADTSVVDSTGRRWASQAAMNSNIANVRRNTGVKQGGYESEGRSTASGNRLAYNNDSQDFVTGQRTGQNTINSGRVNNALNLRRSMASIASGLRQGMRSGAVDLANMNALDSGASDAMARAFARQGNSQANDVNNEAQIAENGLMTEQANLGIQREQGLGRLQGWRENKVNEISTKLWQNLTELDAAASAEGVGGAVDMGIRDRVVAEASRQLDEVDAVTQAELSKITGLDYGQVQAQASQMDAAGAGANPFTYEGGGIQIGSGSAGGNALPGAPLGPIGTGPRTRDDQQSMLPASWVRQDDQTVTA
jgi:hypothetical protein